MRTPLILLALAGPAHAGLYFGDGRPPEPRLGSIRADVLTLRGAAAPPSGPLDPDSPRALFTDAARRLERLRDGGAFSTADRVSLSACYLRLGRPADALRLLERGDKTHFLVLANLATGHFMNGDYEFAARYQSQLLRAWPAVFAPWTAADLARCRVAELAFDRVIRGRVEEARRGVNRDLPLDAIFPGFSVETADGDYEAGELPQAIRDRLPADAERTMMQLLLWLPADMRLYWQMGELTAALGQVELGAVVLDELVNAGLDFKGLRRHRKVLKEAAEAYRALKPPEVAYQLRAVGLLIARSAAPPGSSGHLLAASALTAPLTMQYFKRDDVDTPVEPLPPPPPLPFNLQHIAVSFAFGFLAAALILFQLEEWRRRAARP